MIVLYVLIVFTLSSSECVASISQNRQIDSYILNGSNAPATPYHAHLLIQTNLSQHQTFIGSGALISRQHVITCAQNLLGFHHFRVGLGSINRRALKYFNGTQIIIHPQYNHTNLHNNIGFIVLDNPLPNFTDAIKAIALPSLGLHVPFPFEEGKITGFGVNNGQQFARVLQEAFQRVTTNAECSIRYPHLEGIIANYFCARDRTHNTNVCGGDQGGPFALLLRGKWTLVGITSFTDRDCAADSGAVFVRISAYRQWISDKIGV